MDGRECDYQNSVDLDAAIEVLASLHNASEGFNPAICPTDRCWYGKWPEYFSKRVEE